MTYSKRVREAATRAAAWLDQNRDKHIVVSLATNALGQDVHPMDPDADCFCALGRFVREMNERNVDDRMGYKTADKYLKADGSRFIYRANDRGNFGDNSKGQALGNPHVTTLLRQIGRGEPLDV